MLAQRNPEPASKLKERIEYFITTEHTDDTEFLFFSSFPSVFSVCSVVKNAFPADKDNVIPLLDGDWFTDDISERFRELLKVAFGSEHYEENLRFSGGGRHQRERLPGGEDQGPEGDREDRRPIGKGV